MGKMGSNQVNIARIGVKIAKNIEELLDFTDGKHTDKLSCKEDVELNLKILVQAKDWYDKTVNQQGNLVGILQNLSADDRDYLYKVKIGEAAVKKGGKA